MAVGALDRPPRADFALMTLGVIAVSTSAPLIRVASAPALAVAFWRNAMATGVVAPWALWRSGGELRALDGRQRRLALLAGVLLAAHFATWIPSVNYTSVASSAALVATQPVWAALIARVRGERIPGRAWAGIWVAVIGAAALTGIDVTVSGKAVFGDLLAIAGGVLAAAYMTVGGEVRRTVGTSAYTAICYATTAALLLVACVLSGRALAGYDAETWLALVGLTVGAQLLGHSVFNRVLKTTSATVVSLSILFEPVGAALLAAVFLDEQPRLIALPAAAVMAVGLVMVIRAGGRRSTVPPVD